MTKGSAIDPRAFAKLALSAALLIPPLLACSRFEAGLAADIGIETSIAVGDCPADATLLHPGDDLAAIATASPAGQSFCLSPGEYRLQSIVPKNDQKFYGKRGAKLNGAKLITTFTTEGSLFVATGQTQAGYRNTSGPCATGYPRCSYPDAFYMNDVPLIQVATKAVVVAGTYFFDYTAQKIYFADNPSGKKVEAAVAAAAFSGPATGILVQGLIVEKYASPIQYGSVIGGTRWTVAGNEIRLNFGVGVTVGSASLLTGNSIHDNGEMGYGCNGTGVVISNNEISQNGFFSGLDMSWEGGGGKCALTDGLLVTGNYSHHNAGVGFWTDIDNIRTTYDGNRSEYNLMAGLSHEISYDAVIKNNSFLGNGSRYATWGWGAGIQIQNSHNVEVYNNTVENTADGGGGIMIIQQNRGTGAYGAYNAYPNSVHDNRVLCHGECAIGMIADSDAAALRSGGNVFDYNTYLWSDITNDGFGNADNFYVFSDFQLAGQDAHSTLDVLPP